MTGIAAAVACALSVWLAGGRRLVASGPRARRRASRRDLWRSLRRPRERQELAALPGLLRLLAACLDAGLPLRRAMREVAAGSDGPVAEELRSVLARLDVGMSEDQAWRAVPAEHALAAVAPEVARSLGSGTALAAALRRHADDAAAEHEAAAQAAARAVGVRSVLPLMVCFLPAFLLVGVVPVIAGVVVKMLG